MFLIYPVQRGLESPDSVCTGKETVQERSRSQCLGKVKEAGMWPAVPREPNTLQLNHDKKTAYIYIQRERDTYIYIYVYVYIYMYIYIRKTGDRVAVRVCFL